MGFSKKTVETEIWGWTLVAFLEIPFLQFFAGKWQESQCSLQEEAAAGPLFVQLPNTDEGGRAFQLSCSKLFQQWQINATQL